MNDRTLELPPRHAGRATDLLIGRVLSDQYRVLRKLGEGGVGHVYLAEHLAMSRTVALKILSSEHVASPQAAQDFLDEAGVVGKLGHENIIDIYYGGHTPDGLVFLAMEYLDGADLGAVLRRDGPFSWDRARTVLLQVTSALAAVHDKGLVHRDIKPDNIFLTRKGDRRELVKVLDFGVAKALGSLERTAKSVSGTPQYMSPEQTLGRDVDGRSDIYSLGCVMYQMLTGTLPFQADSVIDLMAKHTYEAPDPPRERRPDLDIPLSAEKIALRAMEKNPAHRFQTMKEMHEAIGRLRLISGSVPVVSGATRGIRIDDPVVSRKGRRRTLGRSALAACAIAAFGLPLYVATRPDPRSLVTVKIDPPYAAVFVDGRQVATRSPARLLVPAGRHRVWGTTGGYVSTERELDIKPRQNLDVTFALELSPATALEITSDPPGGQIWLDGEPLKANDHEMAVTPYTARRLRPGLHVIELHHAGQVTRNELAIEADKAQRIHVVLPPPPKVAGKKPQPVVQARRVAAQTPAKTR